VVYTISNSASLDNRFYSALVFSQTFSDWVYKALVMLVVACPCALAIATPVAMVSAITSANKQGVLVKGSTHIEQLAKAVVVAFDKTGTLTMGELEVSKIIGNDPNDVLRCASALESKSEHSIGRAISERAQKEGVKNETPSGFKSYPGKGVVATLDNKTICIGNPDL